MKIIIIGCGKVGLTLTQALRNENHDISVIDPNATLMETVSGDYDVMGIVGSGACYDDLKTAGADKADLVVATTAEDEINLLSCAIAEKMGAKRCIARVRNPKLAGSQQQQLMRDTLGITEIINPEYDAAVAIARIVRMPSAIHIDTFTKGQIDLAEYKIEQDSLLAGISLSELPVVYKNVKLLICAVTRGEECFIPSGNFRLQAGDRIYITAPHNDLSQFFKKQGTNLPKIRNALIVGGGKITYSLIPMLIEAGVSVKVIEINGDRCLELSNAFPKATVICGDGTNQDLLVAEGLGNADAFIALTGIDEANIILSLFAKTYGQAKIITKINKSSLITITSQLGIECLISPKELTENTIIQYIRAVQNVGGSSICTLYKIADNKAEALEFIANEKSRLLHTPLKQLKFDANTLIAGIIRKNKVIIPGGNDTVEPADRVVVVTTNKLYQDLDEILFGV